MDHFPAITLAGRQWKQKQNQFHSGEPLAEYGVVCLANKSTSKAPELGLEAANGVALGNLGFEFARNSQSSACEHKLRLDFESRIESSNF